VIDAHLHVVDVASVQADAHLAPSGPWWERVDPSAAAVRERARIAGVERAVIVQSIAAHGYDCSYLLSAVAADVALVGAVDPEGPDPVAALDRLAAAGIAGLRLFSIRPAVPWLGGDLGHTLLARCVELGVRPSVCILPPEIPILCELAAAFPDTEFAVDHVAFAATEADLAALAARENLCPTITATSGISPSEAIDRFGRDRLSWGSDHPQHGADYPTPIALPAAERLWFDG
jgi:predicted TIM-barrel fold metal-dependent hydrolase